MSKKVNQLYIDDAIELDVNRLMELTGLSRSGVYELAIRILATYPDNYVLMELDGHHPIDYRKKGYRSET